MPLEGLNAGCERKGEGQNAKVQKNVWCKRGIRLRRAASGVKRRLEKIYIYVSDCAANIKKLFA